MRQKALIGAAVLVAVIVIFGEGYLLARPMPRAENPKTSPVHAPPAQSKTTASPVPTAAKPAVAITPTVGTPSATPSLITVNTATTVTVTVQISPTPIANGVNLLRLGATGTQPTILGVMHDDGLNGDAVANDGIYTLQVPFNEATAGTVQLEASAAFQGRIQRVISVATNLSVWQLFSSSMFPVSFAYPSLSGVPNPTVTTTPDGSVAFDVPTQESGLLLPAFVITLASSDGHLTLASWFGQNVDVSGILTTDGVYTLTNLPDGRAVLMLTGAIPNEWNGGPLPQAYVMSSDQTNLAIIEVSQDDPLEDYGLSTEQITAIINTLSQTINFN